MTVCIADSVRSERVTPHTYMRAIHNGQATTQLGFGEFFKEPAEREPGHLDGRRPYPPPHHPIVMPDGEGALIGEVLIEGDNQGVRGLRPFVHLAVTLAGQTHLDRVPDPPARLLLQQPPTDRSRNVLIQQDPKRLIALVTGLVGVRRVGLVRRQGRLPSPRPRRRWRSPAPRRRPRARAPGRRAGSGPWRSHPPACPRCSSP